MQAGQLRHRVTIQEKIAARDALGAEVITYGDVATVWAGVAVISAAEPSDQARQTATATHTVTLRYRSNVLPTMRLLWADGSQSRMLNIISIIQDPVKRMLTITASEVVIETTPFIVQQSHIGGSGVIQ